MSETELDLARRIAAGTARSPTTTPEFTWFALRWSGTAADGTAWRDALDEHVLRPAEITLSQDMCERLSGLPLMLLHPPKGALDSKAFERSVIGTLAFGYVATPDGIQDDAGTELWAMARVYSADAIAALQTGELSTSPAVFFTPQDGNETINLADGTHILLEKRPGAVSHLSVVPAGVWDRGAGPSGVRLDSTEGQRPMPEETAAEKEARQKREGAGNIDHVLRHIDDAIGKHMKPLAERIDALEKPGKAADDAARKRADAKRRRMDAENAAWREEDPEQARLDDAAEEEERGKLIYAGEPEETAADKAREARRDRVAKRRADSMRDGRMPGEARQTVADAERERREEGERADVQARCDAVAQLFGERAPAPLSGENTMAYRKRLLRRYQKHSAQFKDADLGGIADAATFGGIETVIYADAAVASKTPDFVDDRLIARTTVDPDTGHRVTTFRGRQTIFRAFAMPANAVTKFHTPTNRAA